MKQSILTIIILALSISWLSANINTTEPVPGQWSVEKINKWYKKQPWLVGCNYYPATAINQIEMWQASSWDSKRIDLELSWAAGMGMNTLRVYLHDLVWADDEQGLYQRMDEFLTICDKYEIRPWFVFFDDCHRATAKLGEQPKPVPGYHNSGWLNCPVRDVAFRYSKGETTDAENAQLKGYVQKTMEHFKNDKRVLMWELYNEPGRGENLLASEAKGAFGDQSKQLVYDSWVWAREVNPSQPIMSCTAGSVGKTNIKINRINSDLHSIHSYKNWEGTKKIIDEYAKDNRPVILTEWLARSAGCHVADILPNLKENKVGAINWGFVSGKSATIFPWSSRKGVNLDKEREKGNVLNKWDAFPEPEVWFHDLLRIDGSPYDQAEIDLFRELTETKVEVEKSKKKALKKHNKAIHIKEGWIRDPYIYLADDGYYYLTGTTPEPNNPQNWYEVYNTGLDKSNREIFGTASIVGGGIRVWRSTDLLEWKYLGSKFSLEQGYWAQQNPEVFNTTSRSKYLLWAPELYKIDDRWTYVHTSPAPIPRGSNLVIVESGEMTGEFKFPMGDDSRGKHDPSLFQDEDGTWYLLWGNTNIAPVKDGFQGLAAKPKRIDPSGRKIGHEGATLRKIGDKYVHFGTAWSTDQMRKGSYNLYYCLSDEIMGDYGERRFAGRFLGHGTPFQDKQGRWWCTAFYNANVEPVSRDGIQNRDLSETAQTINQQGVTIVPLEVKIMADGDVFIRAKDPDYRNPGPDEAQKFDTVKP